MIYRILTEDTGNIPQLTSEFFDAFTVLPATGYWRGQKEQSAVIEVATVGHNGEDKTVRERVYQLANKIKHTNSQEAVLVQEIENHSNLV